MINVLGLEKRFGRLSVLRGLDLHVDRGMVTAVVGPNGAGKTTLIKIILGLTQPDRGAVHVDGRPVDPDGLYKERIGYMPQSAHFPDNLTAREVIAMLKDLRGHPSRLDEELLEAFEMEGEMDKPLRTLSGGNRQKVSAVIAFLFDPDILILDEPTAGLDPIASSVLKDKIFRARGKGKTFLLTSHIMSEIEELSDHLAFLLDGQVRVEGPVGAIKRHTGEVTLERAVARLMMRATDPDQPTMHLGAGA